MGAQAQHHLLGTGGAVAGISDSASAGAACTAVTPPEDTNVVAATSEHHTPATTAARATAATAAGGARQQDQRDTAEQVQVEALPPLRIVGLSAAANGVITQPASATDGHGAVAEEQPPQVVQADAAHVTGTHEPVTTASDSPGATLLLNTPNAAIDVTLRGVSLAYLVDLMQVGGVDGMLTIQQVVDSFIRPRTSTHRCCFFDVVPLVHTGKPRYFISHTWSRKFAALMLLLMEHFYVDAIPDKAEDIYLWLDIVAINQHPYEDKGCLLNDDVANLAKVVRVTEQTLSCMDEECMALSRIWCLYEVWQTFLAGGAGRLLLLMPPALRAEQLVNVLNTFDVMQAQATQPADRDRILKEIASSMGPTAVNLALKRSLVDSARLGVANTEATGAALAEVLSKAASLLSTNGEHDASLPLFVQALDAWVAAPGPAHPDALAALSALASCYASLGRHQEALPLFRRELEASQGKAPTGTAAGTLTSTTNLASCMMSLGWHADALPMFLKVMEAREALLGAAHADTLSSVGDYGTCLLHMDRHDEALPLLRRARDATQKHLGGMHPNTLEKTRSLAECLECMGEYEEALPMFRQALEAYGEVRGGSHPDTLTCMYHVARCLDFMEEYGEAVGVFRQVLALRTASPALGPMHMDTLTTAGRLASCLGNMGSYDEGLPLLRRTLKDCLSALGAEHAGTLSVMSTLGNFCLEMGAVEEGEALLRRAYEGQVRTLGVDHPDAKETSQWLSYFDEFDEK